VYDLAFFYGWSTGSMERIRAAYRNGLDFSVENFKMERDAHPDGARS
jgi:hypothetical protein